MYKQMTVSQKSTQNIMVVNQVIIYPDKKFFPLTKNKEKEKEKMICKSKSSDKDS